MVALVRSRGLDLGGETPETARLAIKELLAAEPDATRKVYAALAHKVWTLLIERRLDVEMRDWHGLLENVKSFVRLRDHDAAERVTALADLIHESISLSEVSPARTVAERPTAKRVLTLLLEHGRYMPRSKVLETLGLKSANLSNVMTTLLAHGLVDRRERGKEAEFTLTPLGRELVGGKAVTLPREPDDMPWRLRLTSEAIAQLRVNELSTPQGMSEIVIKAPLWSPLTPANDGMGFIDQDVEGDDFGNPGRRSSARHRGGYMALTSLLG